MKRRLLNILIALDQLVYVLLTLGPRIARRTMSAAAYRLWLRDQIGGRWFCRLSTRCFRRWSATIASMRIALKWIADTCREATRDEQGDHTRGFTALALLHSAMHKLIKE